jgi:branched-chain amino acid transport system substrate-binding protein
MDNKRVTGLIRNSPFLLLLGTLLAAGCAQQQAVEFGAVLPLTGPSDVYGDSIHRGIELAVDELRGRRDLSFQVSVKIEDSQSDPERAAELLDQLYDDGALAAIGGVTSSEALRLVSVAEKHDRVLLSPSASAPELSGSSELFFRIYPSDLQEGSKMANFASETLELEKLVILAKESPYARGIQGVFQSVFQSYGGAVMEVIEFPPNTLDFSGVVDRVKTLEPPAVYLAAHALEIAALIPELRRRNFRGRILTTSAFAAPSAIAQAGSAANDIFLTQAVFDLESEDERVRRFVDSYRSRFNVSPDIYAANGYDAVMVLVEAALRGGTLASDLWKGMRAIQNFAGATGNIQFDDRGDVQRFPRIYVISEGALLDYDKVVEAKREELAKRLEELRRKRDALLREQTGL